MTPRSALLLAAAVAGLVAYTQVLVRLWDIEDVVKAHSRTLQQAGLS